MTLKSVISTALGCVLAGCAGPAVNLVPVAVIMPPAQWRTVAGPPTATDAQWWLSFGDQQLTALVERGLANNTDIGIAAGRVREARAQEKLARAQLFPTLDAGLGAVATRDVSPFGEPEEYQAAQPELQAAYEVDLFGRVANQTAAARKAYLASQAARDAIRLSVASAISSGYVTLCALDTRLKLVERTLEARREALRIARSRAQGGYSPLLELRQSEAEYQATVQIIPQVQLAVARQEDALSVLVGDLPHAVARTPTFEHIALPPIPAALPSDLLRRRPDVAQAEFQLAATDQSLAAARKQFLPQVRLSASAGVALSTLLADPISLWSVGGSVLAPLFEGGRLKAQTEGAGAQRDQAAFAYRRTALNAFREVEDALATDQRLTEQRVAVIAQRDALDGAFRLATNRFRAGYSPYLEQLDAQRALLAAELSLIQIDADRLGNRVVLFQVMGGGWNTEAAGSEKPPEEKMSQLGSGE